jgi:hypothetical protein
MEEETKLTEDLESEGQPLESSDQPTEEETPEAEPQELIAGKYKSVEELERGYKELESKFTQTAQEKAEMNRILQEIQFKQAFVPTQSQPQQAVPQQQPTAEDLNAQFWTNPAGVTTQLLEQKLSDYTRVQQAENRYEFQKQQLRNDPTFGNEFRALEPQLDLIAATMPQAKGDEGYVQNVFNAVRGMQYFGNTQGYQVLTPDQLEEQRRQWQAEYEQNRNSKLQGRLDGGNAPPLPGTGPKVTLNYQEKRIARKMHPELSEADAYKAAIQEKLEAGMV